MAKTPTVIVEQRGGIGGIWIAIIILAALVIFALWYWSKHKGTGKNSLFGSLFGKGKVDGGSNKGNDPNYAGPESSYPNPGPSGTGSQYDAGAAQAGVVPGLSGLHGSGGDATGLNEIVQDADYAQYGIFPANDGTGQYYYKQKDGGYIYGTAALLLDSFYGS